MVRALYRRYTVVVVVEYVDCYTLGDGILMVLGSAEGGSGQKIELREQRELR